MLSFDKYEGLGNDFIVVELDDAEALQPARAERLCSRHFGIGADGVLIVTRPVSAEARARMIVLNADGSRPEMCGNGLRCVALHLARRDGAVGTSYVVDTDAGPLLCEVERDGDTAQVKIEMGRGRVEEEHATRFQGAEVRFARISMGNPHAVVFDSGFDVAAVNLLGPQVSSELPGGSNVEFAARRDDGAFDLVVWERGVGRTLACGTGAAATAVAAALSGRAGYDKPLHLNLPGGALEISVERETLAVTLRGPARFVFHGEAPAQ